MQKTRQTLLQIGAIILCVNGALWVVSNLRSDGPITFGQLLFRTGVFLIGLLLVGGAGILALIEKLQTSNQPEPAAEPEVFDEGDPVTEQSSDAEKESE